MKDKLLSLLGLSRKAGKLAAGFDSVKETAQKGHAFLILTARDISPKTRKEAEYIANKQNIPLLTPPVTIDEIGDRTGKRAGILALTDRGLADTIIRMVSRQCEEE